MYSMIKTITMKQSRKRKNFRLSISPTSPHREVANRRSTAHTFAGFLRWPLARLGLFYPLYRILSNIYTAGFTGVGAEFTCFPCNSMPVVYRIMHSSALSRHDPRRHLGMPPYGGARRAVRPPLRVDWAYPIMQTLDKTRPRGIMKIQKGAVVLTVGPTRYNI